MPNVFVFRIELKDFTECVDRIMRLPGVGKRYGKVGQRQLVIRRDPPGRFEMRYRVLLLSEAIERRASLNQGVQLPPVVRIPGGKLRGRDDRSARRRFVFRRRRGERPWLLPAPGSSSLFWIAHASAYERRQVNVTGRIDKLVS